MKNIAQTLATAALVLGATFVSISPASAVTNQYSFFTTPGGVTGSLSESFAASITGGSNLMPDTFSFTDGTATYGLGDLVAPSFSSVTTDATGALEAFTFLAMNGSNALAFTYDGLIPANSGYGSSNGPTASGPGSVNVPEPATLGVLAVGIVGLAGLRRRRAV